MKSERGRSYSRLESLTYTTPSLTMWPSDTKPSDLTLLRKPGFTICVIDKNSHHSQNKKSALRAF